MTGRFATCLFSLARWRDAIGARKHVSEKHLQDLFGKTFVDVNPPPAPLDLLFQTPNGLVHTRSFPPEAPSDFSGTQIFYKEWRGLLGLSSRDERGGGKIAGHVEHGGERVRDGVNRDEETDPFDGKADGEK